MALFDKENSRAQANFVMKCKECRNKMNINFNKVYKEFNFTSKDGATSEGTEQITLVELEFR